MHTKCTNKTCPFDHDILKSTHNRRIINARDLSFIPTNILHEVIRASADPTRSVKIIINQGYTSLFFVCSFGYVLIMERRMVVQKEYIVINFIIVIIH